MFVSPRRRDSLAQEAGWARVPFDDGASLRRRLPAADAGGRRGSLRLGTPVHQYLEERFVGGSCMMYTAFLGPVLIVR